MTDLFDFFDAWEPLFKARKAKGLDKWAKLQPIAEKLAGKDVKAIAFTCAHPSHGEEPVKHLLGSVEGNLHFMLGYGNPKFHIAPYHWQIIDPNTTSEEAEETFARMHHPSNPVLWTRAGFDVGDEGDTAEGEAHPLAKQAKAQKDSDAARDAESVKAKSPTGSYTCVPSEGLVYGDHNGHVYRWDLIKDSFFSAMNPDPAEAMNAAAIQKSATSVRFRTAAPDLVRAAARQYRGEDFSPEVFPLIKSRVPGPGTIIRLETDTAESLFGVVTSNTVDFYGRDGERSEVRVFDRAYKSFDLTADGNVPPAALLGFVVKNFGVNASLLAEATQPTSFTPSTNSVFGEPTVGYDDVPAVYTEGLEKSICVQGDVLRVVVTS